MKWIWWAVAGVGAVGVGVYLLSREKPAQGKASQQASTSAPSTGSGLITCMAAWACADGSTRSGCSAEQACAGYGGPAKVVVDDFTPKPTPIFREPLPEPTPVVPSPKPEDPILEPVPVLPEEFIPKPTPIFREPYPIAIDVFPIWDRI
ncbi:hypothetical protein [Thermus tengchongensis]|uniref:hypothetical protein n=1 Tax=Thermus tengchongensis TaxID=1214928 RepID=UPI001F174B32|nr:hypothetical protein [Thermus tengchongensis]